jgi:hypothetical protein
MPDAPWLGVPVVAPAPVCACTDPAPARANAVVAIDEIIAFFSVQNCFMKSPENKFQKEKR